MAKVKVERAVVQSLSSNGEPTGVWIPVAHIEKFWKTLEAGECHVHGTNSADASNPYHIAVKTCPNEAEADVFLLAVMAAVGYDEQIADAGNT